jgi:hypothetical protein
MAQKKAYYAAVGRVAFRVPIRDPDDPKKFLVKRSPLTGAIILQRGMPIPEMRTVSFVALGVNPARGLSCKYETSDPDEIEVLDKLVEDQSSDVLDEKTWKKIENPAAYEREKAAEALKAKDAELTAERQENADLRKKLADMEKRAR